MPTWLWGVLIWLVLCGLFAARWDWSRASKPEKMTDAPNGSDSRTNSSDLRDLLARSTVAATGVDQEHP